jgi:hypothetical protein
MGLCIDPNENPSGLCFEIRRESIAFVEPEHIFGGDPGGRVEISKEYLEKMFRLVEDPRWKLIFTRKGVYRESQAEQQLRFE